MGAVQKVQRFTMPFWCAPNHAPVRVRVAVAAGTIQVVGSVALHLCADFGALHDASVSAAQPMSPDVVLQAYGR